MGLLDWLSDGLGIGTAGGMGGGEMPPGMYPGGGDIPMPPVQQTGMDAPSLADPATQAMPGGQGAGPLPPDPMLDAMPSIQGGGLPPPPAAPTPLAPPTSLTPPPPTDVSSASPTAGLSGATLTSFMGSGQQSAPGSTGILESALGLSPDRARQVRASLASGLKSVGENWNKPGLAAFSASAGSGLEGAEKSDIKQTDQRQKFLSQAIAAKSAGDRSEYNKNYAQYLKLKLDAETGAAAGGKKGKGAIAPEKLYLDVVKNLSTDPQIKAAQHILEQENRAGDPKRAAAAQQKFDALFEQKRKEAFAAVKLNPQTAAELEKNPPGTAKNPFKAATAAELSQYAKPGDVFINPKDGKPYIYKGPKGTTPAATGGSMTPAIAPPGPMPSPMTGAPAEMEE